MLLLFRGGGRSLSNYLAAVYDVDSVFFGVADTAAQKVVRGSILLFETVLLSWHFKAIRGAHFFELLISHFYVYDAAVGKTFVLNANALHCCQRIII